MEETPIGASADLVDDIGLQVDIEGAWDVFSRGGLGEERAEAIVIHPRAVDETAIRLSGISISDLRETFKTWKNSR